MEQEADLENWARLNGYWHDDPHAYFKELGYKFYGYGARLKSIRKEMAMSTRFVERVNMTI